MAGEVIREVTVRVGVEVGRESASAMGKAEEAAKKLVGATDRIGTSGEQASRRASAAWDRLGQSLHAVRRQVDLTAESFAELAQEAQDAAEEATDAAREAGQEQQRAWEKAEQAAQETADAAEKSAADQTEALGDVEKELADVRQEIERVSRQYREGSQEAEKQLRDLIAREKELEAAIRDRGRATKSAGGGGGRRRRGVGQSLDMAEEGLGLFAQRAATAALPVAIISMSDEAAMMFAKGLQGWVVDFKNIFLGADLEGGNLTSSQMQAAGSSIADMLGIDTLFGTEINSKLDPLKTRGLSQDEWNKLQSQRITLLQQQISITKSLHAEQRTALQQELEAIRERAGLARQTLEQQKAILETARAQFGLMGTQDRRTTKRLADKIDEQGLGSLTGRELEFVRSHGAIFGQVVQEGARQLGRQFGFREVAEDLGMTERIAGAKEELKIALEQKAEIKLELEGLDEMTSELKHKLQDVMEQFMESEMARVKMELDRVVQKLSWRNN